MKTFTLRFTLLAAAALASTSALAQETKVAIGISGWTGFAPLTLAKEAGIFKKNGLDVTIKQDPAEGPPPGHRLGRHPVRRDDGGDLDRLECRRRAHHADLPARQELRRRRHGGQAHAHRRIADLKGKTVAADAPGTATYFTLAWMLKKNGLTLKDVTVVNLAPQAAANAMIAGTSSVDAAMTYEPFLSAVRAKPEAGKIIATTLDYPMIMDTFGCTPKFLAENPKAAQALADSYFQALEMIKADPKKAFDDHGRRRQAERRGLRGQPEVPALAGQGRQPEVLCR